MPESLFQQGVELMLFGMGTVFVFLIVLVGTTMALSSLVTRFSPADSVAKSVMATSPIDDRRLVAVVAAAIRQHRRDR